MKTCPHCGSILIPQNRDGVRQWGCHNDNCELNRPGLERRARLESIVVFFHFVKRAAVLAFFVSTAYAILHALEIVR